MTKLTLPKEYFKHMKRREAWVYRKWAAGKISTKERDRQILELYGEAEKVSK